MGVTMKVGFVGFGEVASTLSKRLLNNGAEVYTCIEGRSSRTKQLVLDASVSTCTMSELIQISDILISAVVPAQALLVAQNLGGSPSGVYVDINNISPVTKSKIASIIGEEKVVDASIMGSIKRKDINVPIIASGLQAPLFAQLKDYGLNIEVIGKEVGQASALKMLRSSYTKGIVALLIETLSTAHHLKIKEDLIRYLELTEGSGFRKSAISRIISSSCHAERRYQEMGEVIGFLSQYTDPQMAQATINVFRKLKKRTSNLDQKPKEIEDVFKLLEQGL